MKPIHWNPPAVWSLTARGDDLGGAPRGLIFLAKALEGAVDAIVIMLALSLVVGWHAPALLVVPALLAALALASYLFVCRLIVSNVTGRYDLKPWHWACGYGLAMLWTTPAALELGRPGLALVAPLLFVCTYAKGGE